MSQSKQLFQLMEFAGVLNDLVHETQKERGATGIFAASRGVRYREELALQRLATDKMDQRLDSYCQQVDPASIGKNFLRRFEAYQKKRQNLDGHRRRVDSLTLAPLQCTRFYTQHNELALDCISLLTKLHSDPGSAAALAAYVNLMRGKEVAGLERALLSRVFAAGAFTDLERTALTAVVQDQELYFSQFEALCTPPQLALLRRLGLEDASLKAAEMRADAIARPKEGWAGADSEQWFAAMTGKIDRLKDLEDLVHRDLMAFVQAQGGLHSLIRSSRARLPQLTALLLGLATPLAALSPEGPWLAPALALAAAAVMGGVARNRGAGLARLTERIQGWSQSDFRLRRGGEADTWLNIATADMRVVIARIGRLTRQSANAGTEMRRSLQGFIVAAEIQVKRAESPYQDIAGLATDAIQVASTASAQNQDLRELSQRLDRLNAALVEINRAMDGLWLHAERCVDGTGQAERAARGAEENIRSVREHSEKFIQVLEVVRKIARRTNLLALNATIEAARAGDSGKGFQVVALEVAKLSEDTAQNLRFLDDLIAQTDEATLQGSHEVSQVFAMSQEIHALVEAMKAQVGDVRRVLQAQSQANDAILKNVLRMGQSVEEIDRSAARQKASAEALKVTVGKIGTETQWLATESVGLDSLLEEVHTMTAALATVAEDHQGQRLAAV